MGPLPPVERAAVVLAGEDRHSIISILTAIVALVMVVNGHHCGSNNTNATSKVSNHNR
jgi:hypothetical protein